MAGFRTFATGEVLTAANVNDFLMKQSVMVFADATARTAALGAEVTEGMLTFNKDTGALEVFDGSDFVPAGAEPNLVAVKSAIFTGTQTNSTLSNQNFAITDLSITHETADAANKLIISAFVGGAGTSGDATAAVGIAIHDGTNLLNIGDASNANTRTTAGGNIVNTTGGNTRDNVQNSLSFTFVHTPGAGSKTFTLRAINLDNGTQTVFINRAQSTLTNAQTSRAASGLVIQEVKV